MESWRGIKYYIKPIIQSKQGGVLKLTIHQFCQTDHSAGSSQRDCRQA